MRKHGRMEYIMDQIKIGKFIAQCRSEKGLTQEALEIGRASCRERV